MFHVGPQLVEDGSFGRERAGVIFIGTASFYVLRLIVWGLES